MKKALLRDLLAGPFVDIECFDGIMPRHIEKLQKERDETGKSEQKNGYFSVFRVKIKIDILDHTMSTRLMIPSFIAQ